MRKRWKRGIAVIAAAGMIAVQMPVYAAGSESITETVEKDSTAEEKEENHAEAPLRDEPAAADAPGQPVSVSPAADPEGVSEGEVKDTVTEEPDGQTAGAGENAQASSGEESTPASEDTENEPAGEASPDTTTVSEEGNTAQMPAEGEPSSNGADPEEAASSEQDLALMETGSPEENAGEAVPGEDPGAQNAPAESADAGASAESTKETQEQKPDTEPNRTADASADSGQSASSDPAKEPLGETGLPKEGQNASSKAGNTDQAVASKDKKSTPAGSASPEKTGVKGESQEADDTTGGAGQTAEETASAPAAAVQNSAQEIENAQVKVTWKDDNDANNIRPGFLKVYLQSTTDGVNYDQRTEYELNEENGWQLQVENLPGTRDGKAVSYRWVWDIDLGLDGTLPDEEDAQQDEYNLVGYQRTKRTVSTDHLQDSREYTHETVKEKYHITIDWNDSGDDAAEIPKSLKVTLPDGRVIKLSAKNGWSADVEIPVMHKDLTWTIAAADGWVSNGNSTDYGSDGTSVTFYRKWKTKKTTRRVTVDEEVEEPVGSSTLTVNYWIGDQQAEPSFVGYYENGQAYQVKTPSIVGYTPTISKVKGRISDDTTINVRYLPNDYTVTVYYRFLNGETAADTAVSTLQTGTAFTIPSPQVNGYAVSDALISGTVVGRNLTYVVYYTYVEPQEAPVVPAVVNNNGEGRQNEQMIDLTVIDEYNTPLSFGEVCINAGECFE